MFQKIRNIILKRRTSRRLAKYENIYKRDLELSDRPAHLQIEETFDDFVAQFGGRKIEDIILDKSHRPLNADYFFEEYNIIAELKTLTGIFSGPESFWQLSKAFNDAGASVGEFLGTLSKSKKIPISVELLIRKRIRRSFEKRIQKARKQLQSSKNMFGSPNTMTLLLIAIDQVPFFGHKAMILNLAQVMSDNYSDELIDGVVYFHPNVTIKIQPDGMEYAGWYPFYRDDEVNESLSKFVNLLGSRWLFFSGEKFGETNPIVKFDSMEEWFSIKWQ